MQTDVLAALWRSTEALYERFGRLPPEITQATRVFSEESYELVEAALTGAHTDDVTAEAADAIVTAIAILLARGARYEQLAEAMLRVAAKNDSKTHETHFVAGSGKITRRP